MGVGQTRAQKVEERRTEPAGLRLHRNAALPGSSESTYYILLTSYG